MSDNQNDWQNIDSTKIRRGQHLYVERMYNLYYHHGIVITCNDITYISEKFAPCGFDIESLMIIEQNRHGLQIVTIEQFRGESSQSNSSPIHRARYSVSSSVYRSSVSCTACDIYFRTRKRLVVKSFFHKYLNEKLSKIFFSGMELVIGRNVRMKTRLLETLLISSVMIVNMSYGKPTTY